MKKIQKIKLRKDLMASVADNKKTATTRKGLKNLTLGKALFVDSENEKNIMPIIILGLKLITWEEAIADEDLHKCEGYLTSEDFQNALNEIYQCPWCASQEMTVIIFKKDNE